MNEAYQGYAAALGDLIRLTTIDPIQAHEALEGAGISRKNLEDAKVDDFDLTTIFPSEGG